jgi:hypothetical protein
MKNFILLFATLGLTACATSPMPEHVASTSPNDLYWDKVSYIDKNDRVPASAPVVYWETVVAQTEKSFYVGAEGANRVFNVTLNQVQAWDETERYQGVCQVPGEVKSTVQYYDYDCNAISSGSNPLWNAYFQTGGEKKAAALDNAIKGVGIDSAKALIKGGYFRSKPKTWNDFKDELRSAADAGVIKKSVYTNATTQYGADNLQALGYTLAQCRTVLKSDTFYIDGIVDVACWKTRTVTRKQIITSIPKVADVRVKGSVLQPFEKDVITFSADNNGEMTVTGEPYNRYELKRYSKGETTYLTLVGVERVRVNLPKNVVVNSDLQPRGNKLEFTLNVDPRFLPAEKGQDQLVLKYVVKNCNKGMMGCAVFSRDEQSSETQYAVINSANFTMPVDVASGRRAWVEYTVQRKNSQFYNDKFINTDETSSKARN